MSSSNDFLTILPFLIPIFLIQISLQVYCIVNILKKGVKTFNVTSWIVIVLLGMLGAIIYLVYGKKGDENDNNWEFT